MKNYTLVIEKCMKIIDEYHGLCLSFNCFESIYSAPNGYVQLPKIGEKDIGFHAVAVYGYSTKEECFYFQNSWGINWGNKGCGALPFSYFENGLIGEIYAIKITPKNI
jgi:C1A family cysteine protease